MELLAWVGNAKGWVDLSGCEGPAAQKLRWDVTVPLKRQKGFIRAIRESANRLHRCVRVHLDDGRAALGVRLPCPFSSSSLPFMYGGSLETPLYKRAVCQPLADAMALRTSNVCFWIDGEPIAFSLRSALDGLDVSEIAKRFGGGGHLHAAGFKRP
jgi:hypothetical protein